MHGTSERVAFARGAVFFRPKETSMSKKTASKIVKKAAKAAKKALKQAAKRVKPAKPGTKGKWVYFFGDGKAEGKGATRDLLRGEFGRGVTEFHRIQQPLSEGGFIGDPQLPC